MTHSFAPTPAWIVEEAERLLYGGSRVSDAVYAVEWLHAHTLAHVTGMTPIGLRWLIRAQSHLEADLDKSLRR